MLSRLNIPSVSFPAYPVDTRNPSGRFCGINILTNSKASLRCAFVEEQIDNLPSGNSGHKCQN